MKKVVHITTVHPPFDTRIFHKECRTLASAGYDVSLIVQHDCDEVLDGVRIIALPRPRNRLCRILGLTWQAFRLALRQQADVYHFHDPELLPVGVRLKLLTQAKVIYDVHEDVPQQILTKHWIAAPLRRPLSLAFNVAEKLMARALDAVVVATEGIAEKFTQLDPVVIHNYPDLRMLHIQTPLPFENRENTLVYIGGINKLRGAFEMVRALEDVDSATDMKLDLMGRFEPASLEKELQAMTGYRRVRFLGWLPWTEAWQRARGAIAGLVLFHPAPNHTRSLPNKLFEYMAAGLPVIASNFPLWRQIIEEARCGITVDPLKPEEIAEAIEYLIKHPSEAQMMGENGRHAVVERYNWEKEGEKLTRLYEELLRQ
ncbi:MAG TPA: glycosyltransferase family 4 protein [Methanothrix sp.]|nr:glycosyltransferase family 4 protein [Methanothrix sp.]HOL44542.1 glycosyltransferase family 4 protein [Methanothrix sp.]